MRVLYFINAGIMGGRERHVHTLVKSLPSNITPLICAVSGGEAVDAMAADNLNVHVLGGKSGHDPRIFFRFARLIRNFRPDIIHAHSSAFLPYAVLRMFPDIPLIESLHGPSTPSPAPSDKTGKTWRTTARSIFGRCQRKPDYYLPVSKATWDDFRHIHPNAVGEVFYNALNLSDLPAKKTDSSTMRKVIGMIGRMADVKDWPSFVRICASVMTKDPSVDAWAIGDGPVRPNCEALWADLASKNGIAPERLKWLGTRQDARELLSKMSALLITSKSEQLPTTLLEAFAIGVPVVGFLPEGGTREILDLARTKCALLREQRDIGQSAEDTLRVLRDNALRSDLIAEGRRVVREHFDMQKLCATQLVAIYEKVIKGKFE